MVHLKTYENLLRKNCDTLEDLTKFIDEFSSLFFEKEENEEGTTVDVFCLDKNECDDFVTSFEFDKNGNLIK